MPVSRTVNRRRFLTGTAATIAGLSTMTNARVRGANEKVALGLIGAGGRGSSVARGFAGLDNVE